MFSLLNRELQAASTLFSTHSAQEIHRYGKTTASLIACIVPMLMLFWTCLLLWVYRHGQFNPRHLQKTSSIKIQRYTPLCYLFLVLCSVLATSISCWLVLQYDFSHNYPSVVARNAARLLLFTGLWTSLLGGIFTTLLLHPTWSTFRICSIGCQTVWATITFVFWLSGIASLAAGVGSFSQCTSLVYCQHLQALIALAVIELVVLVFGLGFFIRLGWQLVDTPPVDISPVGKV